MKNYGTFNAGIVGQNAGVSGSPALMIVTACVVSAMMQLQAVAPFWSLNLRNAIRKFASH